MSVPAFIAASGKRRARLVVLAALGLGVGAFAGMSAAAAQSSGDTPPPDEPPSSCAVVLCLVGTRCVESGGVARCVPIAPACGGPGDAPCPGLGRCVDDPNDACEPYGERKCPGTCVCDALAKCPEGNRWDSSPAVCDCVPETSGGVSCGPATCPEGQVCCNASCGICTEPGGACIQIACEEPAP